MLKNLPRISKNSMDVPMINGIHYVGNDEELIDHSDDTVAGTLANVLVGVGSTESTVEVPPGNYDLQGNTVVVPENVNLKVNRGAMFSNGTLTINGSFEAGLYQVFDTVVGITVQYTDITPLFEIYNVWWCSGVGTELDPYVSTDGTGGLQQAWNAIKELTIETNGVAIIVSGGIYTITQSPTITPSSLTKLKSFNLFGVGKGQSIFKVAPGMNGLNLYGS